MEFVIFSFPQLKVVQKLWIVTVRAGDSEFRVLNSVYVSSYATFVTLRMEYRSMGEITGNVWQQSTGYCIFGEIQGL